MTFNKDKSKFYCIGCKEWIGIYPCEYLLVNDSIQCFNFHHCGWIWDIFPCEYYYIYHHQGQCRCIQEECNCFGNEEECDNPIGKKSYEQDLEEINE